MAIERKLLILATAALAGIGLLMVYSSSITSRPSFADEKFLIRHLVFMTVGIAIAGVAGAGFRHCSLLDGHRLTAGVPRRNTALALARRCGHRGAVGRSARVGAAIPR